MLHTAVTRALQDDQISDLDRVQELQPVDRRRDEQAASMAMAGDGAGDVDEVHHRAAEDVSERVGVVREDDLHHLGLSTRTVSWRFVMISGTVCTVPGCAIDPIAKTATGTGELETGTGKLFLQFRSTNALSVQRSSGGRSSSRIEWRSETVD